MPLVIQAWRETSGPIPMFVRIRPLLDRIWPDTPPGSGEHGHCSQRANALPRYPGARHVGKVFPIELKPGKQAAAEAIVQEFAPIGPGQEEGTVSFRVYRDKKRPDYLLFVEHFADQAAYDAHTGSSAYQRLVAGQFAQLIVEFVELDHDLLVSY